MMRTRTIKWMSIKLLAIFQLLLVANSAFAAPTPEGYKPSPKAPKEDNHTQEIRQGWTDQPDGRGTLDILWNCLVTLFLCSWSVLCINVPAPEESTFHILKRKAWLTALNALGPEFTLQTAAGQYKSARRSVALFHASGFTDWTVTHGFYADMGGIVFQPRDWKPFPVDAEQLHYLIMKGYVEYPRLAQDRIRDKNKVDGLLRAITLLQALWFSVNTCVRAAQGLAICSLELTTAAVIVCAAGTSFCWLHKPADVRYPDIIYSDVGMAEILLEAGDRARNVYSRTPLDFVSRREWFYSIYWTNCVNILQHMGIRELRFPPQARPVDRMENTACPKLNRREVLPWWLLSALYFAIFIAGWNYSFPTRKEKILWRAASITTLGVSTGYVLVTEAVFTVYPALRRHFSRNNPWGQSLSNSNDDIDAPPKFSHDEKPRAAGTVIGKSEQRPRPRATRKKHGFIGFIGRAADAVRNNSISKDPALSVPLKAMLPMYILSVFYCHARAYIWVSDFVELRSLPASAYQTVKWSHVIPHG